ncbi:uncharacterized protein PHACADRAFT_130328 [Phanerochaete carnosa HHB-10118-sp]|uniref:Uncharacterized protein n=1 Tax=Phanerochaete carnosa (strain HHB-10118-sp) TaxID=650164 RepID=K5VT17_PHACS|nr:uncharacterized protein PHACADRAFT_130328 [Phanerochaete carnosa HHB-10118-sp]EKM49925.1 hypothetical protein PHACADRAFT_130328 [Phanerochaete carnosa HHB-10118-sp]
MDDLYNNAWGDSSESAASSAAWTSSGATSSTQHDKANLANPSWSTDSGIKWDQPPDHVSGFSWATAEPDLAWGSNTYEDIPLEKSETTSTDEDDPTTPTVEAADIEKPELAQTTEPPSANGTAPVGLGLGLPVSAKQESPTASPLDQDGFGTFEDATTVEESKPRLTSDLQDDTWSSPWVSGPVEDEEDETKPVDEWEVARKHKEQLDRKVPPELLASIISQCEEYFQGVAKPKGPEKSGSKEEPWMADWRSGIEGIGGLEASIQTLVPELTLQPAAQFTKTAVAKNVAGCVRLTKNLPLSNTSPMSHYLAAKGSTAWEAAMKQRKEVSEDDAIPVGWRIVEKQHTGATEHESPTDSKASGGLFSFWSRRQSKPPAPVAAATTPKGSSPTRPSTSSQPDAHPRESGGQSARSSADVVRTPSLSDRLPSPISEAAPRKNSLDMIASASTAPSKNYADAPEPQVDLQPAQASPSAVTRFLNRFSRRRSASPRNSLALSTDDLEFLSDIVPNVPDNHGDDDDQSKGLNDILKPEPLPPALPPPPLAPPPRPATTINTRSQHANTAHTRPASLLGSTDKLASPSQSQTPQSDLDDIFGAFEASPPSTSAPSAVPAPAASVPVVGSSGRVPSRSQSPLVLAPQSRTSSPSPLSFSNTFVSTHTEPQLAINPPPLSSVIPVPSLQRSSTSSPETSMSHRPSLKPKVQLSFKLPPPPVNIAPALLSASEVPLAQLYPQAAARQQAQQVATESSSRPTPQPTQPSRSHTPVMVQAPLNSATVSAPLLAPPPGSSRPSATAVTTLLGDDDDFDDFQSSAPAVDGMGSAFFLPPPPSATTKPGALAPLLPLPSSFASTMHPSPSTPQPLSSDPLNDDFAGMLSSSTSLGSHHSRMSGFNSASQSGQSLLATPQKIKPLDFDDVSPVSTALRTPSPPHPISKSPRQSNTLEPLPIPVPPSTLSSQEKQARVNQHMRTLSLVERAAAHPGQWPAPPSPLPQALSFSVLGEKPKNTVDLLGDNESLGAFESEGLKPLRSAPALATLGSTAETRTAQPAWGGLAPPRVQQAVKPSAPSTGQKSSGGLSAQDLSFFEGL